MNRRDELAQVWRRTWDSFSNLFGQNDAGRWDRAFAEGQWTFLDAPAQSPRHYVIGGMLRSAGERASSVLDVGCGTGALVPHLPRNVKRYVGIDISSEAIRVCRAKRTPSDQQSFEATPLEEYEPAERFHVVVFNEMLYYYPVKRIPSVVARVKTLLIPNAGMIIVSVHDRSLKRFHVWRKLATCMNACESTQVSNLRTGLSWRVRRFEI